MSQKHTETASYGTTEIYNRYSEIYAANRLEFVFTSGTSTGTRVTSTSAAPDMHIRLLHWHEHIRTRQRRSSDGNNLKIIKIRLHFVEGSVSEFYIEVLCKIFCGFLRLRAPSGSCHQVLLTPRLSPMATSDVWPGRKRSEKHQVSRTEISRSLEYHWILFSILIILQLPKIPTSKHQKASR